MVDSPYPTRMLVVEIAVAMSTGDQLIYLAHELQHAVEIAGAPDVVSPQTLAAFYARIGVRTHRESDTFETPQAVEVADHVRRELMTDVAVSADDDR